MLQHPKVETAPPAPTFERAGKTNLFAGINRLVETAGRHPALAQGEEIRARGQTEIPGDPIPARHRTSRRPIKLAPLQCHPRSSPANSARAQRGQSRSEHVLGQNGVRIKPDKPRPGGGGRRRVARPRDLPVRFMHHAGPGPASLRRGGISRGIIADHNLVGRQSAVGRGIARTSLAMQREQWLYDYAGQFRVDYLFSPARLAAVELAKSIRNPDCLVVEEIARGRIELQQIRLEPGSPALAIPLRELGLPARVRIGAILRRGNLIVPRANDALEAGDLVTIYGHPRRLAEGLRKLHVTDKDESELNVVIFGGDDYGFALAQTLEGGNFRTRIVEKDRRICEKLGRQLQNCTIINADATSLHELKEERVGDADFFVAATHDDEDNVMACLQARDLGAKACLTLIHRADYASAIQRSGAQLGILDAVSPRVAVARELSRFVTADEATVLRTLPGGIEILSSPVAENSTAAGHTLAATDWPAASGIIAVQHGNQATVPAADDKIEAGDTVVAIVAPEAKTALLKLLA